MQIYGNLREDLAPPYSKSLKINRSVSPSLGTIFSETGLLSACRHGLQRERGCLAEHRKPALRARVQIGDHDRHLMAQCDVLLRCGGLQRGIGTQ